MFGAMWARLRRKLRAEGRRPGWVGRSLRYRSRLAGRRVWRATTAAAGWPLLRYASAPPSPAEAARAERRVTSLLFSAWGMGGTIRTTLNLAAYLAERYEVEIISVMRSRERPFFGEFPPGVKVTVLDDKRRSAALPPVTALTRRLLRRCPSVLVHPSERWAAWFSLWTDVRLVRKLRGRSGFLIGTRPGLNLIVAQLRAPGMITIGEEHMHLRHHSRPLRRSMRRLYPRLDAFAVLTEGTKLEYEAIYDGRPPLAVIPNSIRDLGGHAADLDAKTVLAAGRLVRQKGFDLLIPAFARVAATHPDWRLRICGRGELRGELQQMIEDHGLADVVTLAPPSEDMGAELEQASIFALSSRFEGFPLMLLEAMSKGMGVVSFDCPTGPADLIEHRRNGILAAPRDVDALAAGRARDGRGRPASPPLRRWGVRDRSPVPDGDHRAAVGRLSAPGPRGPEAAASARGGTRQVLGVAPGHAHLPQGLGNALGRRARHLHPAGLDPPGRVTEPRAIGPVIEVPVLEHPGLRFDAEKPTQTLGHRPRVGGQLLVAHRDPRRRSRGRAPGPRSSGGSGPRSRRGRAWPRAAPAASGRSPPDGAAGRQSGRRASTRRLLDDHPLAAAR